MSDDPYQEILNRGREIKPSFWDEAKILQEKKRLDKKKAKGVNFDLIGKVKKPNVFVFIIVQSAAIIIGLPIVCVGILLCLTIIGTPIGLACFALAGAIAGTPTNRRIKKQEAYKLKDEPIYNSEMDPGYERPWDN